MRANLLDVDAVFDAFFAAPVRGRSVLRNARTDHAGSVREDKTNFVFTAVLPGVKSEDVHLDVTRDGFSLSAGRTTDLPEGFHPIRRERGPLAVRRTWVTGTPIDPEGAVARLENGILTVTLPKADVVQPRRLEIGVA